MPYPLTPAALEAAFISFDLTFRKALSDAMPIWSKIASLKTSDTEQEIYGWLDVIPELREWTGERQIVSLSTRSQTLINKRFERTIGIARTKLEDDKYGFYQDWISEIGRVAGLWPDLQVTNAVIAGSTALVYDNQPFFSANHPVNMDDPNSPVQSNLFDYHTVGAGGSAPGLTTLNLADAFQNMGTLLNASGVPYQVEPNIYMVPPQLEFQARALLKNATIAMPLQTSSGATFAAASQTNQLDGLMDVLKAPRLSAYPGYGYLLDTHRSVKPFIWQLREAPEFAYLVRPDDPNVFRFDELQAGVRARGAAGYGPWWLAGQMRVA